MELVSSWMIANPRTVTPDTPLMEADWIMQENDYRHLPVVEGGRLVGIVTDRDLRQASPSPATSLSVYEISYLLAKLTVDQVMSTPVRTVHPDDSVLEAASLMLEARISALPVVDEGDLVGILTTTDLLRALVERLSAEGLTATALEG